MAGKTFEAGRKGKIKCVFDDEGEFISRTRQVGVTDTILCMALQVPIPEGAIDADCPWFDSLKCGPCPDREDKGTSVFIKGIGGTTDQVVNDICSGVI